jgi:hypothetical protein
MTRNTKLTSDFFLKNLKFEIKGKFGIKKISGIKGNFITFNVLNLMERDTLYQIKSSGIIV